MGLLRAKKNLPDLGRLFIILSYKTIKSLPRLGTAS